MDTELQKQHLASIFDRASATYDTMCGSYFTYFAKQGVKNMQLKKNSKVLDIATGKGAVLLAIHNQLGNNCDLTGIDISSGMLEELKKQLNDDQKSGIKLEVMDSEQLKFADKTFDYIFCNFAIFFFPNYKQALSEAFRVLKDGGKIGFCTFYYEEDENAEPVSDWRKELFDKYLPKPECVESDESEDEENQEEEDDSPDFCSPAGMAKVLTEAGFKEVETIIEKNTFYFKDEYEVFNERFSHAGLGMMDRIPKEKFEDFRTEFLEKTRENKKGDRYSATIEVLYTFATI